MLAAEYDFVVPDPSFSWTTMVSLCVVLGVSLLMFAMLVRRWTSRRQWVALARWSRESGFHLRPAKVEVLPQPLGELVRSDEQIRFHLCDPNTTFVQFETDAQTRDQARPKWNVLIRHRASSGAVAGLRPASAKVHLIDLLPLSKFPSLTLGERFVVHASEPRIARDVAESPLAALIPHDLGLILFPNHLVLEFSNRPFDPIEFGRMISLADQLGRVVV